MARQPSEWVRRNRIHTNVSTKDYQRSTRKETEEKTVLIMTAMEKQDKQQQRQRKTVLILTVTDKQHQCHQSDSRTHIGAK